METSIFEMMMQKQFETENGNIVYWVNNCDLALEIPVLILVGENARTGKIMQDMHTGHCCTMVNLMIQRLYIKSM